ncbi:hypothetical protein KIPB_007948 [Kipferlia bialata]|uniref:Uncharacterized protein n=1 Tax=Kipferlia bialata TaxID=797122 RepID=A0A391NMS3_9EUKA|nr:hypothetical protein KIPB_007948 [Kipferlia bialata]|eukprot:g7948.t1
MLTQINSRSILHLSLRRTPTTAEGGTRCALCTEPLAKGESAEAQGVCQCERHGEKVGASHPTFMTISASSTTLTDSLPNLISGPCPVLPVPTVCRLRLCVL